MGDDVVSAAWFHHRIMMSKAVALARSCLVLHGFTEGVRSNDCTLELRACLADWTWWVLEHEVYDRFPLGPMKPWAILSD
jgi:hypothetical protein